MSPEATRQSINSFFFFLPTEKEKKKTKRRTTKETGQVSYPLAKKNKKNYI